MRLAVILILTLTGVLSAQETFVVDDFSDRYFGKVFISDTKEVTSKGWVALFDKKTKKQIIKINSDRLYFDLHDGKVVSNIKVLPYGEQSPIMYEDYNFDGKKDLALMDGRNSCYYGPSFRIYLATNTGFRHSPAFTRLGQEYCGMFQVDSKTKKIHTMTKSTCCWHQYSDFVVKNDRPIAVRIIEEQLNSNGLTWDYIETNRVGGRMQTKEYSLLNVNDGENTGFYSFEFSNKKLMRLIDTGNTLNYVFTGKDNKVEMIYSGQFYYSKEDDALSFTYGKTTYRILSDRIIVPSWKLDMTAEYATITGSWPQLQNTKFDNVTYR